VAFICFLFCGNDSCRSFFQNGAASQGGNLFTVLQNGAFFPGNFVPHSDYISASGRSFLCKRNFKWVFETIYYKNQPDGLYQEKNFTGLRGRISAFFRGWGFVVFVSLSAILSIGAEGCN
jgi:hypothetical protein